MLAGVQATVLLLYFPIESALASTPFCQHSCQHPLSASTPFWQHSCQHFFASRPIWIQYQAVRIVTISGVFPANQTPPKKPIQGWFAKKRCLCEFGVFCLEKQGAFAKIGDFSRSGCFSEFSFFLSKKNTRNSEPHPFFVNQFANWPFCGLGCQNNSSYFRVQNSSQHLCAV